MTSLFHTRPISVSREVAAYEALWCRDGMSFPRMATLFKSRPGARPSEVLDDEDSLSRTLSDITSFLSSVHLRGGVRLHGALDYPQRLRDAKNPLELLYYEGDWDLVSRPSVAIVGARKASSDGIKRARKLAKLLVADGFVVTSGMAEGIDTAAPSAAIERGGKTIAVLGTPLSETYPKSNSHLHGELRQNHLVISQIPFLHYSKISDYRLKRRFFPERNVTMSALSQATVIVEASDTSGTLHQARASIAQKRKLFILDSCFSRGLKWPETMLKKGAIRVSEYNDIVSHLERPSSSHNAVA